MPGSDPETTRTRARPGSATRVVRRIAGGLLVILGVAAAAGAVWAYRFDASLPDAPDGAPPALGVEVGDDLPFEPFTVAVVGPTRGDHHALGRALAWADDSGASLTVVAGGTLPDGDGGCAALADVLLAHPGVVLLAGPCVVLPPELDARLTALLLPPESWEIRTRACTVRGEPGAVAVAGPAGRLTGTVAVPPEDASAVGVVLLRVVAADRCESQATSVPRGVSPAGLARAGALGALWPLAGSGGGLAAVLVAAVLAVAAALRLTRGQ